jgi:hypothetical protein
MAQFSLQFSLVLQDLTWQAMATSMLGCRAIVTFVDAAVEEWALSGKTCNALVRS